MATLFTRMHAAKALWDFGEDAYIDRALALTDEELLPLQEQIDRYSLAQVGRSDSGRNAYYAKVAYTLVAYFEGAPRPLARKRSRKAALLPDRLKSAPGEGLDEQMRLMMLRYSHAKPANEKGSEGSQTSGE